MREPLPEMNYHAVMILMMVCILSSVGSVAGDELPACQPKDFHYEYTECDSEGGRWRVSVPKPNTCIGGAPNPPVRGKDCSFTCSPGQFLDLHDEQTCQPCPAGTYSLGGGVRFDDWETIPDSFSVTSEELAHGFLWGTRFSHAERNCSKMMWKARGSYMYAMPGVCTTTLTYSTKLVKAGQVAFEYQYTDPETIFHFIVQNDQCLSSDEENGSSWPDTTEEGKWQSMTVDLKSGTNILQWRVIGALSDMVTSQKPILIRKIEVTGVAFTSECTKCRNGTYSSGGTAFCAPCDPNKFSNRGANQCESCQVDEYSAPGSASCQKRPPCTKYDYYEYQTPCDQNKQTRKIYKWIEPKVCNDQASGSVALPASTDRKDCPPCNPGMYPVNDSHCEFCGEGFFSDGRLTCKPCPVSTSPEYGLEYEWWMVMPPNVSSHCIPLGMEKCAETAGWQPAGEYLSTSFGPSDRESFLVLGFHVDGFRGQPSTSMEKMVSLGQLTFNFEVNCTQNCQLVFLVNAMGRNAVVKTWSGSVKRQEFTYEVYGNGPLTVSWAFQPMMYEEEGGKEGGKGEAAASRKSSDQEVAAVGAGSMSDSQGMDSVARIYSIKVTNTVSGGATTCLPCPKGTSENGCVPCPDGQYVDKGTERCVDCPPNTVLPSSNSWGRESCKACGEGLKAFQKRTCRSDCHFTDRVGREYDFTSLDGVHYVEGGRLFTSSGTMYYHGFNLTLCGAKNDELPVCVNNVTASSQNRSKTEETELISHNKGLVKMPGRVQGMVCRSTLIPQAEKGKPLVATQPVSLASHLTKIVTNVSLADLYTTGGYDIEGSELDVHFYYKSETPTLACPEGRTTIISLHCDPDEKGNNSIHLPPKCSDGTCDGCTFHFLWRTRHACPRCQREDYHIIRGECVGGEQLIHYYPPEYCLPMDDKDTKPMKQKCQILPFAVMVAIPVALGVGLILILLLIYCWSRNKKLEYKYCKLVESSGGRDGELPGVESCGMEEGEEDESVHFADHKGPRLLQKIRLKISGIKNKDDDNPFVAVQMHEKLPLT
ncbi:endosome/lysosome-associated apoptosis and autophagy regulator family member 2-like isoform X2 [Babylonia areolata]|uniref:endosome/lysosome-associated apoptosis and autophagy regulator family member 2-like isoform X2 n=1 Tax=Babylonia areolata TaxID=304850 RepID=UPI003FD607C2